jgi:hypothetical protein
MAPGSPRPATARLQLAGPERRPAAARCGQGRRQTGATLSTPARVEGLALIYIERKRKEEQKHNNEPT